jgi:hypothetical protein
VQPGKEHPASRAVKARVWPGEASRRVLPSANGTPWRSMMVGQISASSAIRSSCSGVSWVPSAVLASPVLASSSCRLMVTTTDAGTPSTDGWSSALRSRAQASSSASWSRCTAGRSSGIWPVLVFESCAVWCGEWVRDGVQLGTDGVAEPAVQLPHAVAALVEFEIAPVVSQLIVQGLCAVGVGGSDDRLGEPVQLCRGQDGCLVGEQLLSRLHGLRVEAGPG